MTDDRQRVITIAHPELLLGELKKTPTKYKNIAYASLDKSFNDLFFSKVYL